MKSIKEQTDQAMNIAKNIVEEFARKNIPGNVATASIAGLLSAMMYSQGYTKAMFLESCIRLADAQWDPCDEDD